MISTVVYLVHQVQTQIQTQTLIQTLIQTHHQIQIKFINKAEQNELKPQFHMVSSLSNMTFQQRLVVVIARYIIRKQFTLPRCADSLTPKNDAVGLSLPHHPPSYGLIGFV